MAHRVAFGALLVDALLLVRNTLNPPDDPDAALADFALTAAGRLARQPPRRGDRPPAGPPDRPRPAGRP